MPTLLAIVLLSAANVGAVESSPATPGWQTGPGPSDHRPGNLTATVLADGRVLVAGGLAPGDYSKDAVASSELYDPTTGVWAKSGSAHTPRAYHTATRLDDGSVLVAGGYYRDRTLGAERYDPATGTWSPTADMVQTRLGHTATLLDDGRVLVAGGLARGAEGPSGFVDTAEIFDPRQNTWSPVAPMGLPRAEHTATRLADGRVLVTGGRQDTHGDGEALSDATIYDPADDTWAPTKALMGSPRIGHTATLLPNGRVLVVGGAKLVGHAGGGEPVSSTEEFDPKSGSWTPRPPMAGARLNHSATALSGGRVLVVGGLGPETLGRVVHAVVSAELYDSRSKTWTTLPAPPTAVNSEASREMRTWITGSYHAAALLDQGKCEPRCGQVLVVGGDSPEAELFTPPDDRSSPDKGDSGGFPVAVVGGLGALVVVAVVVALVRRRRSQEMGKPDRL